MSDDTSVRLALPLLRAGQAQKEVAHNEALTLVDLLLQAGVAGVGVDAPPAAPMSGQCWIVGTAPTEAWTGQGRTIAGWTDGGWRFVAPTEGMAVWSAPDAMPARYVAGEWVIGEVRGHALVIDGVGVIGPRGAAIADPSGGATVDAPARSAIDAILAAMRAHGLIET